VRYPIPNTVFFLAFLYGSATLSGATITVFGTGLNGAGQFLAPGASDTHYTLIFNSFGTGSTPVVPVGANPLQAVTEGVPVGWPTAPTAWAPDALAQWISPALDVVSIPGSGIDTVYTYQTTFNLTGLDPTTAQLSGHWAADNYIAQVQLNGIPVYTASGCGSPANWSFQNPMPFNISSGFQSGTNTLTFFTINSTCDNIPPHTNPTGLLVDIAGTAAPISAVPEPGTLAAAAVGLGCACLIRLRRKIRR
jgi:hypothetical protein